MIRAQYGHYTWCDTHIRFRVIMVLIRVMRHIHDDMHVHTYVDKQECE